MELELPSNERKYTDNDRERSLLRVSLDLSNN
jgi:hypothetical protein